MTGIIGKIRSAKRIAVVSHIHPDGDAVGSVLGLTLALRSLGFEADAYLRDGVPQVFRFLKYQELISTAPLPDSADLLITLDLPDAGRTGYADIVRAYAKRDALVFIDHHPEGDLPRITQTFIRKSSSSCAELVYDVIKELGARITPEMATALLTGMYTDTGGFQYSNTAESTMQTTAELMRRGAQLSKIAQHISHERSIAHLKLVGIALERIRTGWNGRCAVSALFKEDMESVGASDEDLAGIVNELNTLTGVDFVLLLTEFESGLVRGSLRTADGSYFNVAKLAKTLGGGGHPRASGFFAQGHLRMQGETWRVEAPSGTL